MTIDILSKSNGATALSRTAFGITTLGIRLINVALSITNLAAASCYAH
jgi:hypothetical protein